MEHAVTIMTKWSGVVMVLTQTLLLVGNIYLGKHPQALYWGGGVMLTTGALWMSLTAR